MLYTAYNIYLFNKIKHIIKHITKQYKKYTTYYIYARNNIATCLVQA